MSLKYGTGKVDEGDKIEQDAPLVSTANDNEEADPFGLDALIPGSTKKGEKAKGKNGTTVKTRKEEEEDETKRFLKSQREALIICLEIAAQRYKIPWLVLMLLSFYDLTCALFLTCSKSVCMCAGAKQ